MDSPFALSNPATCVGIDYMCRDGDDKTPLIHELSTGEQAHDFLTSHPEASLASIRLLTAHLPHSSANFTLPWTHKSLDHAIWNPSVYTDLASSLTGGVASFTGEDCRFILQTPQDNGPFCSFALSRRGVVVKGVYCFSTLSFENKREAIFDPADLLDETTLPQSGWRSTGLQIVAVPTAFLRHHSAWLSGEVNAVGLKLAEIETALFAPPSLSSPQPNFSHLNHELHVLSTRLHVLHRRANLESQTLAAIQSLYSASRYGAHTPYAPLAPLRNTIEARAFDLTALPARIASARDAINTLIHQRNQSLHLEVAESSQRIAEATLSDAASMRVIAVLTMCFLPGTAVAGIMGMGMFQDLGWRWIWVYFVVTVPLTLGVLAIWWLWLGRMRRRGHVTELMSGHGQMGFKDAEVGDSHVTRSGPAHDSGTVELQVFNTTPEKGNA